MTSDSLHNLTLPLIQAAQQIHQKLGTERLITILNVVALALLMSAMANWTWRVVQPRLPQVVTATGLPGMSQDVPRVDLQKILNAHLFGQAEVVQGPQSLDDVPLSSLNLVLTGVVAAGPDSVALISAEGQPQMAYSIGEEISHGALLHAVYPDRAILERAGVLESLVLEDVTSGLAAGSVSGNLPGAPTSGVENRIRKLGANDFTLPRNIIGEQLKNPEFLRAAHIVPRKEGGFLVRRMKSGSLYEKIGLKQGDIIKSVNGEELNTIQDAMNHYAQMSTLNQVQVEVIRNGKPEMLQFHLE